MRAVAILSVLALFATVDARKCKAKPHTASPVASATPVVDDNALIHTPQETSVSEAEATPSPSPSASQPPAPETTEEAPAPSGPANPEGAVPASDPLATDLLNAHNEIRRRYGQPDVAWNEELSAQAVGQAQSCNFENQFPTIRQDYTDVIWNNHDGNFVRSIHDAGWQGENYVWPAEGEDKTYQEGADQWTQVVWKATSDIGCGWHKCEQWPGNEGLNGQYKFVCVYNTHQTYVGAPEAFNENLPSKPL